MTVANHNELFNQSIYTGEGSINETLIEQKIRSLVLNLDNRRPNKKGVKKSTKQIRRMHIKVPRFEFLFRKTEGIDPMTSWQPLLKCRKVPNSTQHIFVGKDKLEKSY